MTNQNNDIMNFLTYTWIFEETEEADEQGMYENAAECSEQEQRQL